METGNGLTAEEYAERVGNGVGISLILFWQHCILQNTEKRLNTKRITKGEFTL
jgi:hypothetical protein